MQRATSILSMITVGVLVAGCGSGSTATSSVARLRLTVVATTTQLQDFVREVGGNRVALTGILGPNVDPHEYEPKPSDASAIAAARVVVRNGVGLDDWLTPLIAQAGGSASVVTATDGVELLRGREGGSTGDPHVWLDPYNAESMVRNVEKALAAADRAGVGSYRTNADAYVAKIAETDAALHRQIATVPKSRRLLVTNHDAFGYFARHYAITVVGAAIPSLSTRAEPDARDLARLVSTVRRLGVRSVFSEESLDPKLERAITRSAGVALGAPLFADALGPADGPGGTWLSMMRTNMTRLVAGFKGG